MFSLENELGITAWTDEDGTTDGGTTEHQYDDYEFDTPVNTDNTTAAMQAWLRAQLALMLAQDRYNQARDAYYDAKERN